MKAKNILVLDAARPGSLAALKILRESNLGVTTIACDSDDYSPAQLFADHYKRIPRVTHPDYLAVMSALIQEYKIDLVLPTFHYGFAELNELQTDIFVTDFEKGQQCQDKFFFYERCKEVGLPVPRTRLLKDTTHISGPSYMKPRYGVGAKNNYQAATDEEYQAVKVLIAASAEEYIVQDMLYGEHWGVQCIADETGLLSSTTYITYEVRSGTSSKMEIKPHSGLQTLAEEIQCKLGLIGAFHVQAMINAEGQINIVEINPRHGSAVEILSLAGCKAFHYWVTGDKKYLQPAKLGVYVKFFEVAKL